jgi:hypothetical protein
MCLRLTDPFLDELLSGFARRFEDPVTIMDSIFKSMPVSISLAASFIYAQLRSVQNRYSVAKNSFQDIDTKGVAQFAPDIIRLTAQE